MFSILQDHMAGLGRIVWHKTRLLSLLAKFEAGKFVSNDRLYHGDECSVKVVG